MQRERNDPRRKSIVSQLRLNASLCSMIVRAATCSTPCSLHSAVLKLFACLAALLSPSRPDYNLVTLGGGSTAISFSVRDTCAGMTKTSQQSVSRNRCWLYKVLELKGRLIDDCFLASWTCSISVEDDPQPSEKPAHRCLTGATVFKCRRSKEFAKM
eukprot:2391-Heterococcus_DN1.PRE.3